MPCGSKAAFTRFIRAISSAESSRPRYGALVKPMPCSPLIEPSSSKTPINNFRSAVFARDNASRSPGGTMMLTWMFPSPAWPKQAIDKFASRRMVSTSVNSCGTRPRGTTTSLLSFTGEMFFSAADSSRRIRQISSRSASSPARRMSVAPAARQASSTRAISSSAAGAVPSTSTISAAPESGGTSARPRCAASAPSESRSTSSTAAGTTRS